MTIPNEGLRVCTGCKEPQPEDQFYKRPSKRYRSGFSVVARCRTCVKKETARYAKQPFVRARSNAAMRLTRARTKAATFAAYGGKCACCGETEMSFLSIDHINNDGAKFRREVLGNRGSAGFHTYWWLIKNGFPEGYQVLCMNCQWGKKMNSGICPHQATRNDHPVMGVPASAGKRSLPDGEIQGKDMICSTDESGSGLIN